MLFIRACSCFPLTAFWVNYSQAFASHNSHENQKLHINFVPQQTCFAEEIVSIEMSVLLSVNLCWRNYNTNIHSFALVWTLIDDRCSPWQTTRVTVCSWSLAVALWQNFYLPMIQQFQQIFHTVVFFGENSSFLLLAST